MVKARYANGIARRVNPECRSIFRARSDNRPMELSSAVHKGIMTEREAPDSLQLLRSPYPL
jgi:hypothetical protein